MPPQKTRKPLSWRQKPQFFSRSHPIFWAGKKTSSLSGRAAQLRRILGEGSAVEVLRGAGGAGVQVQRLGFGLGDCLACCGAGDWTRKNEGFHQEKLWIY